MSDSGTLTEIVVLDGPFAGHCVSDVVIFTEIWGDYYSDDYYYDFKSLDDSFFGGAQVLPVDGDVFEICFRLCCVVPVASTFLCPHVELSNSGLHCTTTYYRHCVYAKVLCVCARGT